MQLNSIKRMKWQYCNDCRCQLRAHKDRSNKHCLLSSGLLKVRLLLKTHRVKSLWGKPVPCSLCQRPHIGLPFKSYVLVMLINIIAWSCLQKGASINGIWPLDLCVVYAQVKIYRHAGVACSVLCIAKALASWKLATLCGFTRPSADRKTGWSVDVRPTFHWPDIKCFKVIYKA